MPSLELDLQAIHDDERDLAARVSASGSFESLALCSTLQGGPRDQ